MDNYKKVVVEKVILYLLLLFILFAEFTLNAQGYLAAAGVHGSSKNDYVTDYVVHNDNLFVIGRTSGTDFQTTDGSANTGSFDYFFLRYDTSMNLLESRLIGGGGSETPWEIKIVGSYAYVFGVTSGSGIPSTIGNGFGGITDINVLKLDLNGNFIGGTYIGGSTFDFLNDVKIYNGKAHIVINSTSADFPITGNSTYNGGDDLVYVQLNLADLSIHYAAYIGGDKSEFSGGIDIDGTTAYIGFTTQSTNLPVTDGSQYSGGALDIGMAALDINSGSILALTYLGGGRQDEFIDIVATNGQVFIQGNTNSIDFSVTNGSSPQGPNNVAFAHYDANLNLQTSAYILGAEVFDKNLEYHNGFLYMTAYTGGNNINVLKVAPNGNIIWNYKGITNLDDLSDLRIYNDKVHIVTSVYDPYLITTNGSYLHGQEDFYYCVLSLAGNIEFASFYGGVKRDGINFMLSKDWLQIDGSRVWLSGHSEDCFPVTNGSTHSGNKDIPALLIETCPLEFKGDSIPSQLSQTVCKNGFVQEVQMAPFLISGADLPGIKTCGIPVIQSDIEANYQWQSAPSNSGPWSDIPGATQSNYTPQPLPTATCFRRIAKESACCGESVLQVSAVHSVVVGANEAPYVATGGVYTSCPGIPVTMSATVTGGTPPYQYQWGAGNGSALSTSIMQTVTPTVAGSIIYTITVTDALGCKQIDQSAINTYVAEAGPDVSFCDGQPGPVIGGAAIPGLNGVVYNWLPITGLSCTNCPNPVATPTTNTTYTLTLIVPIAAGGTCSTTDSTTVFRVTSPGADFAGSDQVVCFGDTTSIGTSAVAGYKNTWSPGAYLVDNTITPTVFDHGSVDFPSPNPLLYTITAFKQGCYWYDQLEVSVIRAAVGGDTLCGPKFIGEGDFTTTINESWQWTQLAGDGMILGYTNTPETSVSSTDSITSLYELAATYNGVTCRDTAVVPACIGDGSGAACKASIQSSVGCPSLSIYPEVCLEAYPGAGPPGPYWYSWSPQIGLDTFAGAIVCLTDTLPRTYTVTLMNVLDSSVVCATTINVNQPEWSQPVFSAMDTIGCPYDSVQIGTIAVSGYTYEWIPQTNLSNHLISSPLASVSSTTDYAVLVIDTLSGCTLTDTSRVTISGTPANAGTDRLICNAGVTTLGYPEQPHTLYSWSPATANWQNGTNQNFARPEVLVAITTSFVLMTTDTISGCVNTDSVLVTVGDPIFPFILPNMNYCPSGPSLSLGTGVPNGGNWTYSWSPTINMNDPTIPTPTISPPPANGITYTLVITNPSGCSFQASQVISPIVPSPIVGPAQTICVGEDIQVGSNLNPTGQGIVYSWFPTAYLSDPNSPQPTFTAVTPGTYVYTLTVNKNGCINSATITIVVNDVSISIDPKTVCEGSCINIGVPATQGMTYSWFPAIGLDDPTVANPVACVNADIIYTLVATGPSGCQSIVQAPIFTNTNAAPEVEIDTTTICLGTTGNHIFSTVSPSGAYTYNWTPNNGTLVYPTSPIPELLLTGPGTYTYNVTITNANSGCATEATAVVVAEACDSSVCNLNLLLESSIPPCLENGTSEVEAMVFGGTMPYTYNWSDGSNSPSITQLSNGIYTATVTDASGCVATDSITITNPSLLDIVVNIDNASCDFGSDGAATVIVSGGILGYNYLWDTGQTTATITGLSSGTYAVLVTDANGCQAALSVIVGVLDCCPANLCHEAIMGHLVICDTLDIDPFHQLGMQDCDGDGVTNAAECADATDPQDACDYNDTSIALPVVADQSDCPTPCSDLTPTVTLLPGNIAGISVLEVAVQVTEGYSADSDGSIVVVRMPSDPRLVFVWDIGLTTAALVPVHNADWNYLGDNGIVHNWTYNGPGLTISADSTVSFGFQAFYDPQVTDGQTTLTATIIPFSGGECNIFNNSDSERLVYFD